MSSNVYVADGKQITLEKRIGEGGEGEVFSIAALPGLAAKIYKSGIATEREDKITAMVRFGLAARSETISFPICAVREKNGQFAGFIMRLVQGHHPLHELYTPVSRQQHFPKADYRFLVRSALNISKAIAQAHEAGCMIGDINHSGILISSKATAALIDADSFQFIPDQGRFLCLVGVPEYTPPELQGQSLRSVVRTIHHDAFGLAVVVFQILSMGRHPFSGRFSGRGEMPLERAIKEFRFAYSKARNTQMSPPPGVCVLSDFPKETGDAFERAFSPQYVKNRPKPNEWVHLLNAFERSLRQCSNSRLHHYAREATDCPWCRLEATYSSTLFRVEDAPIQSFPKGRVSLAKGLLFDIDGLVASINAVKLPTEVSYPLPKVSPATRVSSAVNAVEKQRFKNDLKRIARFGSIGIGVLLCFAYPALWFIGIGAAWVGWAYFSSDDDGSIGLTSEFTKVSDAISARVESLQAGHPVEKAVEITAAIYDDVDEFKRLSNEFSQVETEHNKGRHKAQLDRFLERHFLRSAKIERVSSADKAALFSYGIETALDAKRKNVQQVYGIGPVKSSNIRTWVRGVEADFSFNSDFTKQDRDEINRKKSKIVLQQQSLAERLKSNFSRFRSQTTRIKDWAKRPDKELFELLGELEQITFDMRQVGIAVPNERAIPAHRVPHVDTYRKAGKRRSSTTRGTQTARSTPVSNCPRCGRKMVLRRARRGRNRGRQFWGCSRFPACKGTRNL